MQPLLYYVPFNDSYNCGLMKSSTVLWLQVYGGEARITTLQKLFPLMEDKKSIATEKELAMVEGKASLSAAVDYYVSLKSDIFISASPGNMHNALVSNISQILLIIIPYCGSLYNW